MAKNEAKVKFTAETTGFNQEINKLNAKMTQLRSEFKLNETQMKASGTTVEGLENKHRILSAQLEVAKEKTEALSQKYEKAAEIFGENSVEATKLKTQLTNAQNAQEKLEQSVNACNEELKEQREASNTTVSATEKLTSAIEEQQDELNKLKNEYIEAVLKYGETSDEARKLEGEINELSTELKENKQKLSEASDKADELDKSLDDVEDSAKKAGDGFTVMKGALSNLVSDGIQKVTSEMGEFVRSTIDTGVEFTSTMSTVQAISGATGDDLEALTQKAIDLGASTVFSAGEVADAMVEMAKAGWTSEDIFDGMAGVLNATSASGEQLTTVATITADAVSTFGLKASESTRVADLLTQAANDGTIGITDLGETLKYIGPVAGAMGMSIEDATTAITAMSKSGIKGSQAGTSLRGLLTNLVKPTDDMAAAMKELGIEVANADGTMKPLDEIVNDLRGSFDGLTEEQKTYYAAILAGKTGMSGMLALMNLSQEEYDEIAASMENASGVAERTAEVMLNNLGGDLEELSGNFETLKLELFDTFEGTMRNGVAVLYDMVDGVREAVKWMTEHKGVVAAVGAAIGIVTTAIGAYLVVEAVSNAMKAAEVTTVWALVSAHLAHAGAVMLAVAPYIAIVAAIAAVIAIIVLCVKHWDKISAKITEVAKIVGEKAAELKDKLTKSFNEAKEKAVQIFENIRKSVTDKITQTKDKAVKLFEDIRKGISDKITQAKNSVITLFENVRKSVTDKITTLLTKIKTTFDSINSKITSTIIDAKTKVLNTIETLKSNFSAKVEAIKAKVSSVFISLKSKITAPVEEARQKIQSTVAKIKSAFNFKWSLPKLKIPRISVTGGVAPYGIGGKGSLPKFSITWYKNGGILTRPTIFGVNGSSLMGGGEAGPEAILPIDKLKGYIADTVEDKMNIVNLGALADSIEKLADRAINLNINGRNFATATANDSDNVNGLRTSLKGRGLAL